MRLLVARTSGIVKIQCPVWRRLSTIDLPRLRFPPWAQLLSFVGGSGSGNDNDKLLPRAEITELPLLARAEAFNNLLGSRKGF